MLVFLAKSKGGGFVHEEIEVQRGADCFRLEAQPLGRRLEGFVGCLQIFDQYIDLVKQPCVFIFVLFSLNILNSWP